MTPVWGLFKAGLRSRWRSSLALMLLVALAGTVVIGTLAGARRTDTAYDRFLEASRPSDVVVAAPFGMDVEAIANLPQVADAVNAPYAFLVPAPGEPDIELSPTLIPDHRSARNDISKVIAGRRPDPDRADEASVNAVAARLESLEVGRVLKMQALTPEAAEDSFQGEQPAPDGPVVTVRIVGIEIAPGGLLSSENDDGTLNLTPAFARAHGDRIGTVPLLRVKLRRGGSDLDAFKTGVERIAGDQPAQLITLAEDTAQVQRSIRLQALALRLFGALAGLAAVLILGQALGRQAYMEAGDQSTLSALGLVRVQRWLATMIRPLLIVLAGSALAGIGAVLASPLMPLGLARDVEPNPGFAFDETTLSFGMAGAAVLLLAVAALPAWWATRARVPAGAAMTERPSWLAGCVARRGLPPSAVVGVGMAVDPGRRTASLPTRAALVGTSLSVLALVAAFTFGASLQHVIHTPRLYGWSWDALVGSPYLEDIADRVVPALGRMPEVAGVSAVTGAEADVGGARAQAFGFDALKGAVHPPLLAGREPRAPDEIVLGSKTLGTIDREVGQTVTMRVGDVEASLRIVGRAVLPSFGGNEVNGLGEGALLTGEGLARFVPAAPRNFFAVRFVPGVTEEQAREALAPFEQDPGVQAASPPRRLADYARVDDVPIVLAGILALIALATLAHTLLAAVRQRRRDLAILKTLGFVRRQVRATVAWQASVLALVALVIGIPLGLAAGGWLWGVFAEELGTVPRRVVPLPAVLTMVPAAILVANLVAALPARAAARTRPAQVLRSE